MQLLQEDLWVELLEPPLNIGNQRLHRGNDVLVDEGGGQGRLRRDEIGDELELGYHGSKELLDLGVNLVADLAHAALGLGDDLGDLLLGLGDQYRRAGIDHRRHPLHRLLREVDEAGNLVHLGDRLVDVLGAEPNAVKLAQHVGIEPLGQRGEVLRVDPFGGGRNDTLDRLRHLVLHLVLHSHDRRRDLGLDSIPDRDQLRKGSICRGVKLVERVVRDMADALCRLNDRVHPSDGRRHALLHGILAGVGGVPDLRGKSGDEGRGGVGLGGHTVQVRVEWGLALDVRRQLVLQVADLLDPTAHLGHQGLCLGRVLGKELLRRATQGAGLRGH